VGSSLFLDTNIPILLATVHTQTTLYVYDCIWKRQKESRTIIKKTSSKMQNIEKKKLMGV
jgi:hypothetical protein